MNKFKKLLVLLVILVPMLSACGAKDNGEKEANQSQFSVKFAELNEEKKTAKFTVDGFANEEEFKQVGQSIVDSMKKQKVDGDYTVSVYGGFQADTEKPIYGTTHYKDGKLSQNQVKNVTLDEYLTATKGTEE